MANEFLNEYTDHLRDRVRRYQATAKDCQRNGKYVLSSQYESLAMECWEALYQYYALVLNRTRFRWQANYAEKVLRELDDATFEQWRSATRKYRRIRSKNRPESL
jgi:hypothetical protein